MDGWMNGLMHQGIGRLLPVGEGVLFLKEPTNPVIQHSNDQSQGMMHL